MKFNELKKKYAKVGNFDECGLDALVYIPLTSKCATMDGMTEELDKVIKIENGYASIDILNYELFTMNILAQFYCEIEFEKGIDSDIYEWLYKNKFKIWLRQVTSRDSNNFIHNFFNVALQNRIGEHNSLSNAMKAVNKEGLLDIKSLSQSLESLKNIDPENVEIIELMKKLAKNGDKDV